MCPPRVPLHLCFLLRGVASGSPTGHNCVICQDPIFGAEVRAPCGHYYGIDCVTDLFQSATRDESLFPPRCCRQNIPFTQVQPHLAQALVATFQEKQVEFSTLKRVYCSSPTCSRFLGPISEGLFASKVYTCPAPGCARRTCGKCREQHSGDWTHACRPDADAAHVLELGRTAGWARCPGCSQMIELHIGCFHMTCRCRTEFCYLCRARWKTCRCPQWDERRLVAAAEARVDAQLGVGRERGGRRDGPAQRAPPVPVAVPANRVPAPAVRPAVPVPAPAPAPVRRPAPVQLPIVDVRTPQPTPARTPTTLPWTVRPAQITSASARGATTRNLSTWRSLLNPGASASTSATGSGPSNVRSKSILVHSANAGASASTSGMASGPSNTRPKSILVHSANAGASASTSGLGSASGPSNVRPKSIHTTNANADPMRQRLVREMMERLRDDHECDHTLRWRYRHGGGICQSCGHHLPLYLFVSGQWLDTSNGAHDIL